MLLLVIICRISRGPGTGSGTRSGSPRSTFSSCSYHAVDQLLHWFEGPSPRYGYLPDSDRRQGWNLMRRSMPEATTRQYWTRTSHTHHLKADGAIILRCNGRRSDGRNLSDILCYICASNSSSFNSDQHYRLVPISGRTKSDLVRP